MNKRVVALAIIWLIATFGVPNSYIFGVYLNGFSEPAPAGLAWGDSYNPLPCVQIQRQNEVCGERCGRSGTLDYYCKSGDACSSEAVCQTTGSHQLCTRDLSSGDASVREIFCSAKHDGCDISISGSQDLPLADLGVRTTITETSFSTLDSCINNLRAVASDLGTTSGQYSVVSRTRNGMVYFIATKITSEACATACRGRTVSAGVVANEGNCLDTAPTSSGVVVVTPLGVTCPKTADGRDQRCYCMGINPQAALSAVNQITQTRVGAVPTSSLPGTGKLVTDPDELQEPKRFPANEVDCQVPTKVTINASLSLSAVPVGSTVTVNGEVAKFSDACSGVQYTCRQQYQKGCRVEQGFFRTCVVYNSCNPGDKVVLQEGAKCSWNWMQIIGLILVVASVYGAIVQAPKAAQLAKEVATKTGADRTAAAGQAAAASSLAVQLEKLGGLGMQLMGRSQQVYVPDGCNSICGRTTGKTAVTSAPACVGYAIEQKETHFRCRLTTCGGFADKDVTIEVRDASNKVVSRDSTTTDATGFYSFSFPAPSPAGSYTITVATEDPKVATEIVNLTSTR